MFPHPTDRDGQLVCDLQFVLHEKLLQPGCLQCILSICPERVTFATHSIDDLPYKQTFRLIASTNNKPGFLFHDGVNGRTNNSNFKISTCINMHVVLIGVNPSHTTDSQDGKAPPPCQENSNVLLCDQQVVLGQCLKNSSELCPGMHALSFLKMKQMGNEHQRTEFQQNGLQCTCK